MRTSSLLLVSLFFLVAACSPSRTGSGDGGPDSATGDGSSEGGGGDAGDAGGGDDAGDAGGGDDAGDAGGGDDAGDAGGGDAGCGSPSECPAPGTECAMATCVSGTCGVGFVVSGTPIAAQTPGDCRRDVCDGTGTVTTIDDATDTSDDGNECTQDLCSAGSPVFMPEAPGTPCAAGGGMVCDGAGACVGCVGVSDCPGSDTECSMRICDGSHACGVSFVMSGVPTAVQTPGDCHTNQCDGTGMTATVVDDADAPDDGNACTTDGCAGGAGTFTPVAAGASCPGGRCDAGGVCVPAPAVTSADYVVIARGGRLVLTGSGFTGATSVMVGTVAQTFTVGSDTQITIASLGDTTPTGAQNVSVTAPGGTTTSFLVTVISLVVNELDSDTPGTDLLEFVEIATGVSGVSLAGYTLVFFNGSSDTSYSAIELAGTTDANGLLLVGNTGVTPAPALTFTNNTLQNGQDAVAIYQALPAMLPTGTVPTSASLIDAVVYDTADADDPGLLVPLLGSGPEAVQNDEGAGGTGGPAETQSVARCGGTRLDGRSFVATTPSPGAPNGPFCP